MLQVDSEWSAFARDQAVWQSVLSQHLPLVKWGCEGELWEGFVQDFGKFESFHALGFPYLSSTGRFGNDLRPEALRFAVSELSCKLREVTQMTDY